MADDPTLAYTGPESRSIDVLVILYGGAAVDARGVIGNLETSAAEAGMPWSDAGPLAWISYSDDSGKSNSSSMPTRGSAGPCIGA